MPVTFRGTLCRRGHKGLITFWYMDKEDALTRYFGALIRYSEKRGIDPESVPLEIYVKRWYRMKTPGQRALYNILLGKLAEDANTHKDLIKESIKQLYGPLDETTGVAVKRPFHLCNTIEAARYIDGCFLECAERGIPAYEEYLKYHALIEQKKIEVEKLYGTKAEYREAHPFCEASGRYLVEQDKEGKETYTGHIHHIVPVGEGGADTAVNWIALHGGVHRFLHDAGAEPFLRKYPHLKYRFAKARKYHEEAKYGEGNTEGDRVGGRFGADPADSLVPEEGGQEGGQDQGDGG